VFLTGQVNRQEQRGERPVRQRGFQETDIVSMAKPITKAAWQANSPEEVPRLLRDAFRLACVERPGPVLLDLPMDVQRLNVVPPSEPFVVGQSVRPVDADAVCQIMRAIRRAQRPLIIAGGGLRAAQTNREFRQFVARTGIPVVHSLLAVDALPWDNPLRVGMIGTYGNRWANLAIGSADYLLVLGSRLDVRQTGANIEAFKGNRVIDQVDVDPGEINSRVSGCRAVVGDLKSFFAQALEMAEEAPPRDRWLEEILALRNACPDTAELTGVPGINPNAFMHQLSRAMRDAAAFVVDVGQHQMWAAQSLELQAGQRFLTSGGMGSLGFALPAAIGASFARPGQPVVVIAGDGGFQCNIQELETIVHEHLPLKIGVVNNQSYGMVRQFQGDYFEGRYQSTVWGYSAPDFVKVAAAYGIPSRAVRHVNEVQPALDWLSESPDDPCLLEVAISVAANAYPKIAFGHPLTRMEPQHVPQPEVDCVCNG
jgi:acetolactate synthase-1/2/3 large subunit